MRLRVRAHLPAPDRAGARWCSRSRLLGVRLKKLKEKVTDVTHRFKESRDLEGQYKQARIKSTRRALQPGHCKAGQRFANRVNARHPGYGYPDGGSGEDIGGIVKTQIDARETNEENYVEESHNPRGAPSKKNGSREREKHRRVVAGKGTPVNQFFLADAVRHLEMNGRISQRSFTIGQCIGKRARHHHRQKTGDNSAEQIMTMVGFIRVGTKPGPPDERGDHSAFQQLIVA